MKLIKLQMEFVFIKLTLFLTMVVHKFNVSATVLPSFDRQNENVTVIIGNYAVLPCFISNLGDHKVAWIKVANMDILAIGDYKVTNDDRIKLLHGYISDWSLSIQPVNEEDAGEYICQVNTEPQIITKIYLEVLLPPKIIEEKSTISPGPVKEGSTLNLYCHSEGIPAPKVTWYFRKRSSQSSLSLTQAHHLNRHTNSEKSSLLHHNGKSNENIINEGSTLIIKDISRVHSGIFECIANNSVPPAASRKIKVSVEFAPEINVQSHKVEQLLGMDARFECKIKANPLTNHYWMKDGHVIENSLVSTDIMLNNQDVKKIQQYVSKYEINIYNQNNNEYLTVSALTIRNITTRDFGVYQCYAVNSYNTSKAEVELKEILLRRPSPTKVAVSRILIYNNGKDSNSDYDEFEYRSATKTVGLSKHRKTSNSSSRNSNKMLKDEDELNENLLSSGGYLIKFKLNLMLISIFCVIS